MSTFVFKAMDLTGAKATGEVDADSKQVVADQLKSRGLIVLDIKSNHASKEISLDFLKRIKAGDLTIMVRQLATMISAGMTILRGLYVLEAQTENKLLADVIAEVRKDVEAGLPLSGALERHPKVFSPLFVAMTRAGETGGMLEESLLRVADQLEKEDSLRRQIKSAMVYPGVIATFALIVLLALVIFLAATIGGVYGFRKFKRSEWGRPRWDAFRLRVPMKIGDIVQKVALARWSRTLSALVSAGVPLLQALDITAK